MLLFVVFICIFHLSALLGIISNLYFYCYI